MSRFPRITETFVLYEILELEKLGFQVEVYPLIRERAAVQHPEAAAVVERAHFRPFLSAEILAANWYYLSRRPAAYLRMIGGVVAATFGSLNLLLGGLASLPKAVWFARDMERRGVGHIHAHFANHPATAAWIAGRLTGIPFSFTAHGSDIHVEQRSVDRKIEAAAFAVMVSEYNREFLIERFGPRIADRMHVVHCGIDPDVFCDPGLPGAGEAGPCDPRVPWAGEAGPRDPRVPWASEAGPCSSAPRHAPPFRILCVASFREVKGHRYLIEACRLLRERGVEFTCDLVGDGSLRQEIERRIAAAGLGDRFVLHGSLPQPRVIEMMRRAHVAVLPSILERQGRREGIPVTLMEAMASGLPVVSSRLSGIPELVESGTAGLLTPPGDSTAVADALETLWRSPELRERMGRAGREKVLREFNLRKNAARLARLFLDSSGSHGPARPTRESQVKTSGARPPRPVPAR